MRKKPTDVWLLRVASSLLPSKIKRWLVRSPFLRIALTVSPAVRQRLGAYGISAGQRRHLAQRSIELRRKSDWEGLEQMIEGILADKHSGLQPAFARDFAGGLRGVSEDPARHAEITSELIGATQRVGPTEACPDLFLCLCQLAISHGLFEASGAARVLATESALARAHSDFVTGEEVLVALQAALDRYDLKSAQALRERLRSMAKKRPEVDLTCFDQYMGLLSGKHNRLAVTLQDTESSRRWVELVSGRVVALVGPAPSGLHSGDEIDNQQTVARMNFRGAEKLPPAAETGRRTDISYYNGMDCRQIRTERNRSFFSELRMAIFKGSHHTGLAGTTPARVANRPDPILLTGNTLMGPIALFDLLCGGAAVKLYNMNFFVSERPYFSEYRNWSVDAQGCVCERDSLGSTGVLLNRCLSLANHEPLSQLHFVQNLWRAGRVSADAACTGVLRMSDADYLRALDTIYGRDAK
jgi:hypothetical protein